MMRRIGIIFAIILIIGCSGSSDNSGQDNKQTKTLVSDSYKGKKILYIDSYNEGLPWSDGITSGVKTVLDKAGVEYSIHRMDTKRNPSEEFSIQAAKESKKLIESFQPDVLIVSDDNAFKYLVKQYYRDADLPVVFCGVNWNIEQYDGPYSNTAGMLEVVLMDHSVTAVLPYAKGERIGFLTEDTLSEHSNADNFINYVGMTLEKVDYVKNIEEWKKAYIDFQQTVDVLIIGVMGSYYDWNDASHRQDLIDFVMQNTKIPTVTEHKWMVEFTLLAYGKIAEEQGEWASNAALQILDGKSPQEIGIVKNKKGELAINLALAKKLGIIFDAKILKTAQVFE